MKLKSLTTASVLIFVPWTAVRAQSPQPTEQRQMLAAPIQSYSIVPFPITMPTFGKCLTPAPAAAPTAWVGAVAPTRQIVWGPGPIGSSVAWLGEKMTHAGRRHVWTVQHSRFLRWPQPQAQYVNPGAVYYQAVPVAAPAAVPFAAPSAQAFQPATVPVPPAPSAKTSSNDEAPPAPAIPLKLPDPYRADLEEQPGPLRIGRLPE